MPTWDQVSAWNPDPLEQAGQRFAAIAEELRRQSDVATAEPHGWTGEAADAAAVQRTRLGTSAERAAQDCDNLKIALYTAADRVAAIQHGVATVREFARGNELTVRGGGEVVDAAPAPDYFASDEEAIDYGRQRQGLVDECVAMMDKVLERAEHVDADLTAALSATAPGATEPLSTASTGGTDSVEAPSESAAAGSLVGWWSSLTPAEQTWVFTHHPEWLTADNVYGGDGTVLPLVALLASRSVGADGSLTVDGSHTLGAPPGAGYADDPVNVAAGNFVEIETDLSFSGLATGLTFTRTYNSRSSHIGALGPGWSCWADVHVERSALGAHVHFPDGRELTFRRHSNGAWPAIGAAAWLSELPDDAGFRLDLTSGVEWHFDSSGRISLTSSGPGTTVRFTYQAGRLASMHHELGRALEFTWLADAPDRQRLAAVRDTGGRWVHYHVDDRSHLVAVRDESGERRYELDDAGRVAAVIDADGVVTVRNTFDVVGRVLRQVDPNGRVSQYAYLSGHVTVVHDGDGKRADTWISDAQGRLVAVIDSIGQSARRVYDVHGNVVEAQTRSGGQSRTEYTERGLPSVRVDPAGTQIGIGYDDLDRVIAVAASGADGTRGGVVRYRYTGAERSPCEIIDAEGATTTLRVANGLVHELQDADGVRLRFGYDDWGDLVEVIDAEGARARFTRDDRGRLTSLLTPAGRRTVFRYRAAALIQRIDPDGARWNFTSTAAGRRVEVVDPTGVSTRVVYGANGKRCEYLDGAGNPTRYGWDDVGNLTSITLPDGSQWHFGYDSLARQTSVADANGHVWQRDFDVEGQLRAVTDPTGVRVELERDAAGQPLTLTDGAANIGAGYDSLGRFARDVAADGGVTRIRHDRCGRPVEITDPQGVRRVYTYSPGGKVVAVQGPNGVTRFEYDSCGRTTLVHGPGERRWSIIYTADGQVASWSGPGGQRASYNYNLAGRLVRSHEPGHGTIYRSYDAAGRLSELTGPAFGRRRFRYDAAGRLSHVTDALGRVTEYRYDSVGRLVETLDTAGGLTVRRYDPSGRLTAVVDPLGRATTAEYDDAGRQIEQRNGDGSTLHWEYDGSGREAELTAALPGGAGVAYRVDRDLDGRRLQISSTAGDDDEMLWDASGRLVGRRRGDTSLSWEYDAAGRRTAFVHPDTSRTTYEYDDASRVVALEHPAVGRALITRDPAGRVLSVQTPDFTAEWTWVDGVVARQQVTRGGRTHETVVERDAYGRVLHLRIDGDDAAIGYDPAGQLVSFESATTARRFSYDPAGRISEVRTGSIGDHLDSAAPSAVFTYDAAGQLASRTFDGRATHYTYDGAGRRTSASGPTGTTTYGWDARGYLASIQHLDTTPSDDGGESLTAARTLHVDALGELARIDELPVVWDSAQWPAPLVAVGETTLVGRGAATAADSTWLPADWRGQTGDAHQSAFGEPWPDVVPVANTGSESDGLTIGSAGELLIDDLVWLRSRVFAPEAMGFLSPDPLPAPLGTAWSTNRYAFAGNNPLGLADPSGLRPITDQGPDGGLLGGNWNAAHPVNRVLGDSEDAVASPQLSTDNWRGLTGQVVATTALASMLNGVGGPGGDALMRAGGPWVSDPGQTDGPYASAHVDWVELGAHGAVGILDPTPRTSPGSAMTGVDVLTEVSSFGRALAAATAPMPTIGTEIACAANPLDAAGFSVHALSQSLPGGLWGTLRSGGVPLGHLLRLDDAADIGHTSSLPPVPGYPTSPADPDGTESRVWVRPWRYPEMIQTEGQGTR